MPRRTGCSFACPDRVGTRLWRVTWSDCSAAGPRTWTALKHAEGRAGRHGVGPARDREPDVPHAAGVQQQSAPSPTRTFPAVGRHREDAHQSATSALDCRLLPRMIIASLSGRWPPASLPIPQAVCQPDGMACWRSPPRVSPARGAHGCSPTARGDAAPLRSPPRIRQAILRACRRD